MEINNTKAVSQGRDSVVGIAARYGLDGLGFEPRWVQESFFSPYRLWSSPNLLAMSTGAFYRGVKRSGRDVDHLPRLCFL